MRKITGLFTITVFLLIGCAATQLQYTPMATDDPSKDKMIIEQVLQEQPSEYVPDVIEITDNYLKWQKEVIRRSRLTGGVTTVPGVKVVYFNSIGKIELYQKTKWYIVLVYDDNQVRRCRVLTRDEHKAQKFMDAIYSMKMRADTL